jgi:hypothetical protein
VKHLIAFLCAIASCAAVIAHAQTDELDVILAPQSQWLSASPDAPQIAFFWSGHLRGRLSARIPFIGGLQEPGFSMALLPLIATKRYWKLFPMIGKSRLDMTGVLRLGARAHFCPESA